MNTTPASAIADLLLAVGGAPAQPADADVLPEDAFAAVLGRAHAAVEPLAEGIAEREPASLPVAAEPRGDERAESGDATSALDQVMLLAGMLPPVAPAASGAAAPDVPSAPQGGTFTARGMETMPSAAPREPLAPARTLLLRPAGTTLAATADAPGVPRAALDVVVSTPAVATEAAAADAAAGDAPMAGAAGTEPAAALPPGMPAAAPSMPRDAVAPRATDEPPATLAAASAPDAGRLVATTARDAAPASEPAMVPPAASVHAPAPAATPHPVATPPVAVAVATPAFEAGWHEEVASKVAGVVLRGHERAEVRLSPADLGPVEVRLDVRAGEATVAIVAPHAATRDALEQALPMLRDLLAQQGLSLGETSVRDGRADARDGQDAPRGRGERSGESPRETLAAPAARPRSTRLVDTFA